MELSCRAHGHLCACKTSCLCPHIGGPWSLSPWLSIQTLIFGKTAASQSSRLGLSVLSGIYFYLTSLANSSLFTIVSCIKFSYPEAKKYGSFLLFTHSKTSIELLGGELSVLTKAEPFVPCLGGRNARNKMRADTSQPSSLPSSSLCPAYSYFFQKVD